MGGSEYKLLDKYTAPVKRAERPILGRETEMRRVKAALMRPELCNVMLLAPAGSGKALADGTMIPVADARGYVPIQDLVPGDLVFDEHGHPVRVLGVYPQGLRHAFEVTFGDGSRIRCCAEHLWAARSRHGHKTRGPYRVRTLGEMTRSGIRASNGGRKWWTPVAGAVRRPPVDLPVDPYVVGMFLGSGSIRDSSLHLACDDFKIVRRVCRKLGARHAVPNCHGHGWNFVRADGSRSCTYLQTSELAAALGDDNSVFGVGSRARGVPAVYFAGSVEQRTELLWGLMDSNGFACLDDRTPVRFSTRGRRLADDVVTLARSLGYRASLIEKPRPDKGGSVDYEVHFRVHDADKPGLFWSEATRCALRKHRRTDKVQHRRFDDLKIDSVEDLDVDLSMTCIYVDSETHLFQAGRCHVVTHNTALVQGTMVSDPDRRYLEVDLSRMISDAKDANELASMLKLLFDETARAVKNDGQEIVLFIDEFHQIVQLSAAAVEALKPLLADSGTRGIRVIAATTYVEFRQYIAPNQPLVERLQRINLAEPDKRTVMAILKNMASRYGAADEIPDDALLDQIYEYTNRYIPSNAQPRKSLLVMDAMLGWHRAEGRPLDMSLLADVIYESEGVNVAFRVDASQIKAELDKRVLSQQFATAMIEERLQICVADLNNKKRPMSSFLFSGSSGVGKSTTCSTVIPVWTQDGVVSHKLAGDVRVGDYVFDREGRPTRVLGVFPQGERDVYRVTLTDGRYLDVSDNHLWAVVTTKRSWSEGFTIYSTRTLMNKGVVTRGRNGSDVVKYLIPASGAVRWPAREFDVDPYVVGVAIGDGSSSVNAAFTVSSDDEFVVAKVSNLLGAAGYQRSKDSYDWTFLLPDDALCDGHRKLFSQVELLGRYPELYRVKSPERRIPHDYMTGSVEQRWALVNGLFDTDGSIGRADGDRFNVTYSTHFEGLARDVRELLYSLGVASTVSSFERERDGRVVTEYRVHVRSRNCDKHRFFTLPRKLDVASRACGVNKQRERRFDFVGIRSVEALGTREEMVCFYVDNDEHLYQAGMNVVTHNTEIAKTLAEVLFQDRTSLIAFDMTEYANPSSLERFRREMTARVWAKPFCILLLDEIEKACAEVTRLLLQVLDDGRLMDENNRVVSFLNCYIILTTNAGSEVYRNISQYNVDDSGSGRGMSQYNKLIRESITKTTGDNRFPPELLGRINVIVPFQPLSEQTMKDIAEMNLQRMRAEVYKKHGVRLAFNKRVIKYLVEDNLDTNSDSGGARTVISKLESEVTIPIARYINQHPDEKQLVVEVEGVLACEDETIRVSDAYVSVRPIPASGS